MMGDAVINDDWEVAVDTGEFDKRHEQQEKDRAAKQASLSSYLNENDNRNVDLNKSNKPIRILKRPTSQSQLPVTNDVNNSQPIISILSNTNQSSPSLGASVIPRNPTQDDIAPPQTTHSSSQSIKPPIKTYEQREAEYRLARLRIMGEEESSTKDDDDTILTNVTTEPIANNSNEPTTSSSLETHSTPGSSASNLYPLTTGAIHFTPNTTGPFSQQAYRGVYSVPYPPMPLTSPSDPLYMPDTWCPYQQQQQPPPFRTPQYDHPR